MKHLAFNPYLPNYEYVPDAEARVFGDRLYVYGSHDHFNGKDFCVGDYVCWSAPVNDLGDWRCEGVIYRKTQDPRNPKGISNLYAPDCIQGPDGRYYLYYQLHLLKCTCVAVADHPAGPFEYYGAVRHPDGTPWGEKRGDTFSFDPGIFVDTDGRVYLYVGFAPKGAFRKVYQFRGNRVDGAVCLELDKDMLTVKGEEHPIVPGYMHAAGTEFEGHAFFEASSMRKIGERYYFVYSSELSHELCYAVSNRPDSGFTYGGTLISIGNIGYHGRTNPENYTGNTHGGIEKIGDQWYVFYHRQTNRQKCARQGCAEKITLLPDGSIPQVETTSCGLNSNPLSALGQYPASIVCALESKEGTTPYLKAHEKDKRGIHPYLTQYGEDRESDGDQYIANLCDGSTAGFRYFSFQGNESTIRLSAKGDLNGKVDVYTDRSQPPVATIMISPSEARSDYSSDLSVTGGTHPLYFQISGEGHLDLHAFEIGK